MSLSITLVSIITLTIGLFVVLASIILHDSINRMFQFRIAPMVFGIIGLLVFFFGKYIWYILDFVNNAPVLSYSDYVMDQSLWEINKYANLFLLRIPDLLLLVMSLALIFDKTKNLAKTIAPFGLFMSVLYLICSSLSYGVSSYISSIEWYEFIFVGDGLMRMPTITFVIVALMSLWSVIAAKEYSKWSIFSSLLLGSIILVYCSLMQIKYNIGANGMTLIAYQALYTPNYVLEYFPNHFSCLNSLLKINTEQQNVMIPIILIVVAYFVIAILTYIFKNIFTKDIRRVNYIYKPWYYKSLLFRSWCGWIDGCINDVLGSIFKNAYLYGIMKKDVKNIKLYVSYLQTNKAPDNIDKSKLDEMVKKADEKQTQKEIKKQKKQQQKEFNEFENEFKTTKHLDHLDTQMNDILKINIVQEWSDQTGTVWGLDANGKYFYKQDGKWLAYQ